MFRKWNAYRQARSLTNWSVTIYIYIVSCEDTECQIQKCLHYSTFLCIKIVAVLKERVNSDIVQLSTIEINTINKSYVDRINLEERSTEAEQTKVILQYPTTYPLHFTPSDKWIQTKWMEIEYPRTTKGIRRDRHRQYRCKTNKNSNDRSSGWNSQGIITLKIHVTIKIKKIQNNQFLLHLWKDKKQITVKHAVLYFCIKIDLFAGVNKVVYSK